jgi:hypothetical protein
MTMNRARSSADAAAATTFEPVDTDISCVITRFRLKSPWSLLPMYLAYRRVRRESRRVKGLLQPLFVIEGWRTCYTISFWANGSAILEFNGLRSHVMEANRSFSRSWNRDMRRAEIWSVQMSLSAISRHNLRWEGFDLRTVIEDESAKRRSYPMRAES